MTDFRASMPAAYARAFGLLEIGEHARIVARRGEASVHAELWTGQNGARVCVVAEDRPGLLALVTDALLVHGLGIKSAQIYCRTRADGRAEAVDFFELEDAKPNGSSFVFGTEELAAFSQTLSELIVEHALAAERVSQAPKPRAPAARVYFELEALRRGELVLLVEAPNSEGLLNAITSALHVQGVRILTAEIRTENGLARDRFDLASSDGSELTAIRACDIQQAVLAALPDFARR